MGSNPTPGAISARQEEKRSLPIEEDVEYLRMVRILNLAVFVTGVALLALDLGLNYLGTISIAEAYILTPGVIIFLFSSLILFDSATRTPWKGHFRIESDFAKSSIMVLGAVLIAIGGGFVFSSVGGDLTRVTVDVGAGTTIMVSGLYLAARYKW